MTTSIFSTIKFYVSNFGFYDYVAVSWVILLFLALFILAIYMMFKRPFFAIILFLLSFVGLGAGINYSLKFIDDVTRPKDVNIGPLRQLFYSDVMIADINITNKSKQPFKTASNLINEASTHLLLVASSETLVKTSNLTFSGKDLSNSLIK